ncbi:hypothetical protein HDE_06400 [Halotydeus destructor]|nr:hypothetical protein HDE_06400 [Halotydeus destructor]
MERSELSTANLLRLAELKDELISCMETELQDKLTDLSKCRLLMSQSIAVPRHLHLLHDDALFSVGLLKASTENFANFLDNRITLLNNKIETLRIDSEKLVRKEDNNTLAPTNSEPPLICLESSDEESADHDETDLENVKLTEANPSEAIGALLIDEHGANSNNTEYETDHVLQPMNEFDANAKLDRIEKCRHLKASLKTRRFPAGIKITKKNLTVLLPFKCLMCFYRFPDETSFEVHKESHRRAELAALAN